MALPSKNQIDKLGKRLANSSIPAESDRLKLVDIRIAHDPALAEVEVILSELGLEFGSRIKTDDTIIEKLRREKTRLSTMQDIAGARVVIDASRIEQDRAVQRIVSRFDPGTVKVVDRRAQPSHGYRAVHIIVEVLGVSVEIQVRTKLQHLWAQLIERLADMWGRQVRYGEPPDEPDALVGADVTRGALVSQVRQLTELVDSVERQQADLEVFMDGLPPGELDEEQMADVANLQSEVYRAETEVRTILESLAAALSFLSEALEWWDS